MVQPSQDIAPTTRRGYGKEYLLLQKQLRETGGDSRAENEA